MLGRRAERTATNFLRDSSALRVNQSRLLDLRALAQKYSDNVVNVTVPCTEKSCGYTFDFSNPSLKGWHWLVNTTFSGNLAVSDDRLAWRSLFLTTTYPLKPQHRTFVLDVLEYSNAPSEEPPLQIPSRPMVTPVVTSISIRVKPSASEQDHNLAYALRLQCLSSVRGCADPLGEIQAQK